MERLKNRLPAQYVPGQHQVLHGNLPYPKCATLCISMDPQTMGIYFTVSLGDSETGHKEVWRFDAGELGSNDVAELIEAAGFDVCRIHNLWRMWKIASMEAFYGSASNADAKMGIGWRERVSHDSKCPWLLIT